MNAIKVGFFHSRVVVHGRDEIVDLKDNKLFCLISQFGVKMDFVGLIIAGLNACAKFESHRIFDFLISQQADWHFQDGSALTLQKFNLLFSELLSQRRTNHTAIFFYSSSRGIFFSRSHFHLLEVKIIKFAFELCNFLPRQKARKLFSWFNSRVSCHQLLKIKGFDCLHHLFLELNETVGEQEERKPKRMRVFILWRDGCCHI